MRLSIGNRAETIASLKNHEVDVALMGRPARDVPVRASAFGDHPLVIIAAPDHPLARTRDITPRNGSPRSISSSASPAPARASRSRFSSARSRAGWTIPEFRDRRDGRAVR